LNGVTTVSHTQIGSSARRIRSIYANGRRWDGRIGKTANISGASGVVIAIDVDLTLSDGAGRAVSNNSFTSSSDARNSGTTISNKRKRNWSLDASVNGITGSGVANILGIARNSIIGTEVLQWVRAIREVANIVGASIVVIATGVVKAGRHRTRCILGVGNVSSDWIARIGNANGHRWYGDRSNGTAGKGITTISVAKVGTSAINGGAVANSRGRNLRIKLDANLLGASIVVIAIHGSKLALGNGASSAVKDYTLYTVARYS